MKNLRKQIIGICMLLALVLCALPVTVQAGQRMTVTVGTTNNASAGDNVTVRLVGSNNPGISTFSVKVQYDPSYLSYTGTDYANSITADGGMVLATEVDDTGGKAIHVSFIAGRTYSINNEVMATVKFRVNQAYNTMPVTVTSREVDNSSYQPVHVEFVVDANAGLNTQAPTQSGSQPTQPTQSGSQPTQSGSQPTQSGNTQTSQSGNTQTSQSQSGNNYQTSQPGQPSQSTQTPSQSGNTQTSQSQPGDTQTSQNPGADGNNPSGGGNPPGDSSSTGGKKPADQTPKTGAFSLKYAFGGAVALFLGISVVCIKVLGKKSHP